MSAIPEEFLSKTARVNAASVQPFPNSRKIYVEGSRPDIRVPMREITLTDTVTEKGAERNPPVTVYDTSGPYTDPDARIDIRQGLDDVRTAWIEARRDTEILADQTSEYGRQRAADPSLDLLRFEHHKRQPRRALRQKRHYYPRDGICGDSREHAAGAIPALAGGTASGAELGCQSPERHYPGICPG